MSNISILYFTLLHHILTDFVKTLSCVVVLPALKLVLFEFLPRDALVHSAVLRLHVVRPSVLETNCTVN